MSLKSAALIAAIALGVIGVAVATPILIVEKSCVEPAQPRAEKSKFRIEDAGYQRALGDSFLSYPEWAIVYAYADLAGVTKQSSESGFDYLASITGFWSSLCRAIQVASRTGAVTADQTITNYVIAVSFSVEMGLLGLYERSLGALTSVIAGGVKTTEDDFNLQLLERYAAFLYQTPWYQFPFGAELQRLWRDVPITYSIRGLERRVSLSLQYALKAAYAAAIRTAAGYAPAALTIRSLVTGADALPTGDSRIRVVRAVDGSDGTQATMIETPRYQAFTDLMRDLGKIGDIKFLEIAGNRRILITVLTPPDTQLAFADAVEVFSSPIQSKPGWRRVGLDTSVPSLIDQIRDVARQGAEFEHAYDY